MKNINTYIVILISLSLYTIQVSHASEDKANQESSSHTTQTQHPPHDHHQPDHIKKLDESMRRKREDEEKSH
jgi:hypothetical protein